MNEGKEGLVTNACTQFFEEVRALKICRVGVGTEPLPIINWNIYKALRIIEVNSICPPPTYKIGMKIFVIDKFRICCKAFIQPGLLGLVVCDLFKPPLM